MNKCFILTLCEKAFHINENQVESEGSVKELNEFSLLNL
jgi:hypothetical protein